MNNLPYGSFDAGAGFRPGVRIGDSVVDLRAALAGHPRVSDALRVALDTPSLDGILAAGHLVWAELRELVTVLLGETPVDDRLSKTVHAIASVRIGMPFTVSDYVDFYTSEQHALRVAEIFQPERPELSRAWKHLPIGYHGRSATVVASGTDVVRPKGLRLDGSAATFGPTRQLDFEAEVGFVVGTTDAVSEVSLEDASRHIFGVVLLNDWSARDIQMFESAPLGPHLGKSFATAISPWVVPIAALENARVQPPTRDTPLAPYLDDRGMQPWGFDLRLAVELNGEVISRPPFSTQYWTAVQMLAHMTVNGAILRSGGLFGSGTVSGERRDQRGCLLELTWNGTDPLPLADGTTISYLADGDEVRITATAPGAGGSTISLGEVTGWISPATAMKPV
nr:MULTISPECIES: fumarylacetoacetate hydrolase family protein [unclassified Cryobacterium]